MFVAPTANGAVLRLCHFTLDMARRALERWQWLPSMEILGEARRKSTGEAYGALMERWPVNCRAASVTTDRDVLPERLPANQCAPALYAIR